MATPTWRSPTGTPNFGDVVGADRTAVSAIQKGLDNLVAIEEAKKAFQKNKATGQVQRDILSLSNPETYNQDVGRILSSAPAGVVDWSQITSLAGNQQKTLQDTALRQAQLEISRGNLGINERTADLAEKRFNAEQGDATGFAGLVNYAYQNYVKRDEQGNPIVNPDGTREIDLSGLALDVAQKAPKLAKPFMEYMRTANEPPKESPAEREQRMLERQTRQFDAKLALKEEARKAEAAKIQKAWEKQQMDNFFEGMATFQGSDDIGIWGLDFGPDPESQRMMYNKLRQDIPDVLLREATLLANEKSTFEDKAWYNTEPAIMKQIPYALDSLINRNLLSPSVKDELKKKGIIK